jgi:hypothetical protein
MARITLLLFAFAVTGLASGRQAKTPDPEPPPPKLTLEGILKKYPKDEAAVEKLFQMTLDRKPTPEESKVLMAAASARGPKGRAEAYRDFHFAITNSKEYVAKQKEKEKAKEKAAKGK